MLTIKILFKINSILKILFRQNTIYNCLAILYLAIIITIVIIIMFIIMFIIIIIIIIITMMMMMVIYLCIWVIPWVLVTVNVPLSSVHCAYLPAVVLVCESELRVCPSGPPTSLVFLLHIQVAFLSHGNPKVQYTNQDCITKEITLIKRQRARRNKKQKQKQKNGVTFW